MSIPSIDPTGHDEAPGGPGQPDAEPAQAPWEEQVPPERRSASEAFFASMRRTGVVRTEDRWIGGVAGGLARRTDVDPTLVRCVWIVVGLFTGLGLLLYGLAWMLLPEESDGRIHAEQALVGDVSAGLAGSIFLAVFGLATLDHGLVPSWYIGAWDAVGAADVAWGLMWLVIPLGIVYLLVRAALGHRRARQTRRAAPMATADPVGAAPAVAPPAAGPLPLAPRPQQPQGPLRPRRPRRPLRPRRPRRAGPGRRLGLAVIGTMVLALAACVAAVAGHRVSSLAGAMLASAVLVLGLGAGVVIAGLRGRRGGWMSWLAWPALLLAVPVLALGTVLPAGVLSDPRAPWALDGRTWTWSEISSTSGTSTVIGPTALGQTTIDLSGMSPQEAAGHVLDVTVGAGTISLVTHNDQPVIVHVSTTYGPAQVTAMESSDHADWSWDTSDVSGYTFEEGALDVTGTAIASSFHRSEGAHVNATLSSPAVSDPADALVINATLGAGLIAITDRPSEPYWYGLTSSPTWVVQQWIDATGAWSSYTSGDLPGLAHPAVSQQEAEQCLDTARASTPVPSGADTDEYAGVYSVPSYLTEPYESCLAATAAQDAVGASAQATATATPTS